MATGMRMLGFADLAEAHAWLDEQTDEKKIYPTDEGADLTEVCLTLADGRRRNPLPVLVDREPYKMDSENLADLLDETLALDAAPSDDYDDFEITEGVPESHISDEDTAKTIMDSLWERLERDQNNVQIPPGTPLSVIVPGVQFDLTYDKPSQNGFSARTAKHSSWKNKKSAKQFQRHRLSP